MKYQHNTLCISCEKTAMIFFCKEEKKLEKMVKIIR